jgi:hypothetical protein
MCGYFLTDSGALNRLYHLWIYKDMQERVAFRAGLAADHDWNNRFVTVGFPLIQKQQSLLMEPVQLSEEFEAVVANRLSTYPADTPETPLLSDNAFSLTISKTPLSPSSEDLVGHWRVVSGVAPGSEVTLARWPVGDLPKVGTIEGRHEILRGVNFSPLK